MLRFALPPSLGTTEALARAKGFSEQLSARVGAPVNLLVAPDYNTLQKMVTDGVVDAAWAPPFICARLELRGLRVALRGSRDGASTYRAAIVCRSWEKYELTAASLKGVRAAWVDRDSVGGYMLAAALLKSSGLEPAALFAQERFAGSYREALKAVAEERADITSIFAAPGGSYQTAVKDVLPAQVKAFGLVAYTQESPNDGVVLSASLDRGVAARVTEAMLQLHTTGEGLAALTKTFRIERFEPSPAGGYRSLYRLALAAP